jgi:hypothetical protein
MILGNNEKHIPPTSCTTCMSRCVTVLIVKGAESVLQWMYIVPVVVMMMFMQFADPNAARS